jgi:hypothetical protein
MDAVQDCNGLFDHLVGTREPAVTDRKTPVTLPGQ